MRIAYVVHQFLPEHTGGTEIYTWTLARALSRLGHETYIFYPRPSEIRGHLSDDLGRLWRGTSFRKQGYTPKAFWHTIRNHALEKDFAAFMKQIRPQVVHFQHLQNVSLKLINLATNVIRVMTLHDYWYICPNSQLVRPDGTLCNGCRSGWECTTCVLHRGGLPASFALRAALWSITAWRQRSARDALRGMDLFLAPSQYVKNVYAEHTLPAERIRILENGLDPSRLGPLPQQPKGSDQLRFGYLGGLAWQKGVHILIQAFNRLPPGPTLRIYGDESAFPEYVARLRAMAKHPGIRFCGLADYRKIGTVLAQLDVLVIPSIWPETYGMVMDEAQAMGVIPLASRIGALQRIRHGIDGLLFTPGEVDELSQALLDLINHPAKLDEMRRNLQPGPTIQEQAERLINIYTALLDNAAQAQTSSAKRGL